MSTVWLALLKFALSVAVTAVRQVPAAGWEQVGGAIASFLEDMEARLPAGNPMTRMLHYYHARPSMLNQPRSDDE